MVKTYLLTGLLLLMICSLDAQTDTSTYIKVNKTELEFLYNQYFQEGDHSAVTGGKGTEKLIVYGPAAKLKRTFGKNEIDLQIGADIISSASTDNIDFDVSSASRLDTRSYLDLRYGRFLDKQNLLLHTGLGFSIESDYFSALKYLGFEKTSKNKMQSYSAQLKIFNDDLRWGRLDEDYYRPIKLIYPEELNDQEWYDIYHRNSYNLALGFTQVIDKKNVLGLFSWSSFQEGLLSTPFHRIYFSNDSLAVEQLPRKRYKAAVAVKWNHFLNGNIILKNTLNTYADNFGVLGLSLENETAIKLKTKWVLTPAFRFYIQKGSKYFAPFEAHTFGQEYYSSDFDLSDFRSYKTGLSIKYQPFYKLSKKIILNSVVLNYQFYYRSDGLIAHICSLYTNFEFLHGSR